MLSSIVAAAGLISDSAAVVIGAMVIAPLIGPFTALSFSALLGDLKLMRRSLSTSTLGIVISLIIAILFGFDVVIEGVETLNQLVFVRNNYADKAQGYLIQKPVSKDALALDLTFKQMTDEK